MNRSINSSIFAVWALFFAGTGVVLSGQEIPDYPPEKITEHAYVIHGPVEVPNPKNRGFMNNPVFVVTAEGVVVMDPGSSLYAGRMVLRQIRKVTDRPVIMVFNSHVHGDHWLGNQAIGDAYPNAKIYAHPEMIAMARAGEDKHWVELMETLTGGTTRGTKALIPSLALENGQEIKAGGLTFRAHLTDHAHTKTDAMIEVVEDSLLVTGDNVLHRTIRRMNDGSFRGTIKACNTALALNLNTYVPGHGPTSGPDEVVRFRDYLKLLYEETGRLYEEGLEDYQMKSQVVAHLKEWQHWSGFEDEVGRHIGLAIIEAEQAAFE
ncbi:MAG: MBL fold metallo-hydrolase [Gammaproteobacteria bacterium]|nr:MBL fold metallo-hydrolase [Gammaproteobacteria bacterium]